MPRTIAPSGYRRVTAAHSSPDHREYRVLDAEVTVRPAPYNGRLPAQEMTRFGFVGNGSGATPASVMCVSPRRGVIGMAAGWLTREPPPRCGCARRAW